MLLITSLTAFLVLIVSSVAAKPIVVRKSTVSLSIARRVNITGAHDLVKRDQTRAKNLVAFGKAKQSGTFSDDSGVSVGVTNAGNSYVARIGVGTPLPLVDDLLIDTGSSNTWVGAGKSYVRTSPSVQTNDRVSVTYGSGSFGGTEFLDAVTITSELVITNQSIGVASRSDGFAGVDGILGIGPVGLTLGTLNPDANTLIPTVTDNLYRQGTIEDNLISVSFEPTNLSTNPNGELTFGGTDSAKYTGSITYFEFWGIDQSIQYRGSTILSTTAGIVDTGTTLILIATNAIERYKSAAGATIDRATGLLRITSARFNELQSLFFTVGDNSFELTANAQIWPCALHTEIGGRSDHIYLVVNDIGTFTGEGLDFINGYTFLERFYSVFDTTNNRVGFATTQFTTAITN